MKIAIIGAGVSGLVCAYELESYGINPDIFEAFPNVGGMYNHVGAELEVITRSEKDPLRFSKYKYDINVHPTAILNKVIMNGPNKRSIVEGSNLGWLFVRGPEQNSLEYQLYNNIKSDVKFNTKIDDIREIQDKYDYVIVATGNGAITKQLGCFQDIVETWVKGTIILGEFDPNTLIVWFNTAYAKSGYAYLAPYDSKRAALILAVPYINRDELEEKWQLFLKMENITNEIVDGFEVQHNAGSVYPHVVENIYFIGNAAGSLEPFLGFGQHHAAFSAAMAAKCIVEERDYEKELQYIRKQFMKMLEFRKALDMLSDKGFDFLVSFLGFPGINKIIYHTGFNIVRYSAWLVDNVYNRFWGRSPIK